MNEESTVKISIQMYFVFNSNNNYFNLRQIYGYIHTHYSSTGIDGLFEIILIFLGMIVELWLCYQKTHFRDTYLYIK